MTETIIAEPGRGAKTRKTIIQAVIGAAFGGFGMFGTMWALDTTGFDIDRLDHVVAIGTALVYTLMGLFLLFGTVMPGLGAKVLNVEDEAEIRYERSGLLIGSVFMLLFALGLAGIALYATDGAIISREAAAVLAAISINGQLLIGAFYKGRSDEMDEVVVRDTAAFIGKGLSTVFGLWAVLAHLGYAPMFTPLAFVAGLNLLFLLGLFVSLGRRGALA